MKKSVKEGIVAVIFGLVGMLTFMVLAMVSDNDNISSLYVGLAFVALIAPVLVYGFIQDYRKEKPIYERAKRIKALKEKNGYIQSDERKQEMHKGIGIMSFLVLCIIAAYCCFESGYTGAGIVFLGIGTVIGLAIRFWQEGDCDNKKQETAKTESVQ